MVDLIKTGIQGLDELFLGGVTRGNIIIIQGAPGTGKTTTGVEFIYRGVTDFDEPGMIVSFEVSPDKLTRDALAFGWDLAEFERQGKLKIILTSRDVFYRELQESDSLLLAEAAQLGVRRVFVDSIRMGPTQSPGADDTFLTIALGLERQGITAMLALDGDENQQIRHGNGETFIADTIVCLGIKRAHRSVQRTIEIVKSRGQDYIDGIHSFSIVDKKGIEIFQRVQSRRSLQREQAGAFEPTKRLSSGVPGLDELLSGGYLIGSSTMIVGVSGVGKSVAGLQYLREGVNSGQRGIMITLDEPPVQVIRNAAAIGFDLQAAIDAGQILLMFESPQEIQIDRHFSRMEEAIRNFKPHRAVIDSLQTYASSLGSAGRDYSDFVHAIVVLLKEYQVTAVYNHENPEVFAMSSMMGNQSCSSLLDNIILMNWVELGDTFRHALTVAKTRANPTNNTTHECEIIDGEGMRVLQRKLTSSMAVRPFSSYKGLISRAPERNPDTAPDENPQPLRG
jgi:circadian clock protein KaiC